MQQILDLHIHSKYSRACSPQLTLPNIEATCRIKGVDIVATGDFTYPDWFRDIKENLTPSPFNKGEGEGRVEKIPPLPPPYKGGEKNEGEGSLYLLKSAKDEKIRFILSTEFALIYKKADKVRRIHIVLHAPNIEAVEELNKYLDKKYNIRSDGRPILGMNAEELCKICFSIHPKFLIYPAHIWTPWFSVFGSKSGFDSMAECFGEYTDQIYAYETGLSSDPEMNWRLSALDKLTLLSNSDAHSLPNIGREANVMDLDTVTYDEIYKAIKEKDVSKLKYSIEFYPEEGMYHYDGHRDCSVRMTPGETKKNKGICPKCKKKMVIGVMYRVDELADRALGFKPKNAPGFKKLVELDKIIAEALGIKSRSSLRVQAEYNKLISQAGSELDILIKADLAKLKKMTYAEIVEGIRRVREGELIIEPGFDGQYGVIKIFKDEEKVDKQQQLF